MVNQTAPQDRSVESAPIAERFTLSVTAEHIRRGRCGERRKCALALALHEATGHVWAVGYVNAFAYESEVHWIGSAPLGEWRHDGVRLVTAFDAGQKSDPCVVTFESAKVLQHDLVEPTKEHG